MPLLLTSEQIAHHAEVLQSSLDAGELYGSATQLAAAESGEATLALGRALRRPEFYARLDQLDNPQLRRANLHGILEALRTNPSVYSGRLLTYLAGDPAFLADSGRLAMLLPALAAVAPMTPEAAEVFRRTNAEGYFSLNGPLLLANGSPEAVALFEEMVADRSATADDRIAMIRTAVVPRRIEEYVVAACARLLSKSLEPGVEMGLIEAMFDYQERKWFGVAKHAPAPPAWGAASTAAILALLGIAKQLVAGARLTEELRATIAGVAGELEAILQERGSDGTP